MVSYSTSKWYPRWGKFAVNCLVRVPGGLTTVRKQYSISSTINWDRTRMMNGHTVARRCGRGNNNGCQEGAKGIKDTGHRRS